MARIEKYIQDNNITDKDIVLGSDADDNNKTKNYTVNGLKKYITKDFDASEQNNVIKSYTLDTSKLSEQFVESQTSNELAAYLINRINPTLEVKSDEIYFFKMAKGNKFYTLSLSNLGKGIYGLEGTQIDKSNIQIISEKSLSANNVVEDSTTDSYDLGSIQPLNVSQALNLKNPPIDIKPLSQGFTIFNTVENGEVKSYLYQGSSGLTGLNENQTVLDDFDLIDQQGFEPGDPIPEYLLGLDDNDLLLRKDSTEVSRIGMPIANLSYTASPNEGKVVTDKGTDATIPLADNINAGLLSPSEKEEIAKVSNKVDKDGNKGLTDENYSLPEKQKLANIEEESTKNDTDANLRDRSTHTGVQAISTVTGLQSDLDDKENKKTFKEVELDNYTLTENDVNNFLVFNSNNPITLYVPESLDRSIVFEGVQNGDGKITFAGVGLIEIESPDETLETGGKNDVFRLTKKSENKYVLQKQNFALLTSDELAGIKNSNGLNYVNPVATMADLEDVNFTTDESLYLDPITNELRLNVSDTKQRFVYDVGDPQEFTLLEELTYVDVFVNGVNLDWLTQYTIDAVNKKITILDELDNNDLITIKYQYIITT